eukprot:TRINITY_DN3727_c0_g1_i2.p1 TRINITY_DN3727_c0_g1~~TRINITY_DN3727_c0_g1_i2.p1  ORF type:complete len:1174 (-),score=405.04 TRINITY_DN3727_c0_g1_i2:30-3479(-)
MESLTCWGYISPTTPEKLIRLETYYKENVLARGERLSPKMAEKLLHLFLSITGETNDERKISGRVLTDTAKQGLRSLMFFLLKDEEFQNSFERKESSMLRVRLQMRRHLSDPDPDHVQFANTFLNLVKRSFPKFANWMEESSREEREIRGSFDDSMSVDIPRLSMSPNDKSRLPPEGLYYDTEVADIISLFHTNIDAGLTEAESKDRQTKYGLNKLAEPPSASVLKMFFHQFTDFMVIILLVVSIVSLGLQHWIEAGVLLLVIVINCTIGFVQEYKAERALQALKLFSVPVAKVIRDSTQLTVPSLDIVPGDIILLDEGDAIPADLRIVESIGLAIIESVLTGESVAITKTVPALKKQGLTLGDRTNMAFMSTTVSKGRGKGVVVSTGTQTEVGKISSALIKPSTRKTLLQQRLSKLGKILVVIAVTLCAITVGIGFGRTAAANGTITGQDAEDWIKVGISLAISVIPEGLVTVTTITYALGIKRMMKRNAVVRRLPAVETIGSITTICSDKTGTLTEGKMTAVLAWASGKLFSISGSSDEPTGEFSQKSPDGNSDEKLETENLPGNLREILKICALCNNSRIEFDQEKNCWKSFGDPTEIALTLAAEKAKLGKSHWTQNGSLKFLGEAPFDSDRKRMSVLFQLETQLETQVETQVENQVEGFCVAKGAPESIFGVSKKILWEDQILDITQDHVTLIEEENKKMGEQGMRVLGLAMKTISSSKIASIQTNYESMETDLVFVGLIAMIDPPRKEVRGTVQGCKEAGIRVCMITGDHPRTAFAIGCMLGICEPTDEGSVITGQQLDAMTKSDLSAMTPFPAIFARVSPDNKLKIVTALQMRGEICAMTGDGTNDAPAIKNADIGIAMGKGATDMAKDAADVILSDDNFTTIVEAITEGRRTYDNIKKFVFYLLACNSAEIWVVLFAVIIGLPVPFTPIMILWANLIADLPPALALGSDPPVSDIMQRKPRNPKRGIFTKKSGISLLFYGFSMAAITLSVFAIAIHVENYPCYDDAGNIIPADSPLADECYEDSDQRSPAKALAFVALTSMQLVHSFLIRSNRTFISRDFFNNPFLWGAFVISVGCLVAGCYIPGLNEVLSQWPLGWVDWLKILACVFVHVVFVEVYKAVMLHWAMRKAKRRPTNDLFYQEV